MRKTRRHEVLLASLRRILPVAIALGWISQAVAAESLSELLASVATNARFEIPTRADVRIERRAGDAAITTARAILLGRGDTVYVEVKDGARALVTPRTTAVALSGRVADAALGATLPGTDLLLEDLTVFSVDTLKVPQVSDDGPAGVVVTGAPSRPSAYSLLVFTFDRGHHTVVRTQYYRDAINNLVKIRRDSGFIQVGGRWRPAEINVENLRDETSTRLTLEWRAVPDASAALFDAAGLEKPSGLPWPER